MKKNILTKISKAIVILSASMALFTIVLPFGTITFGGETGVSYEPSVSTYADDDPDYINYK